MGGQIMSRVTPTDVYDKDGNMLKIEFHESSGDFAFQALWDPTDEQSSEKREAFRTYAYRMASQLGYEVNK
jgi:hypothetical protein